VPLNDQEKINAEYVGVFKQKIDALSKIHLVYWEENKILTKQQIARMKEVELTVELVGAMLRGLQDGKRIVRTLYNEFDDEFIQHEYIKPRFGEILGLIEEIFSSDLASLEFKRPPLFYSIFAAIYDLKYGFSSNGEVMPKILNSANLDEAKQELFKLNQALLGKEYDKFKAFVTASKSSTDKINSRKIRHSTLIEILGKCFVNG
jgi:hypothetical protein